MRNTFFALLLSFGVLGCVETDDQLPAMENEHLSIVLYEDIRDPEICPRDRFAVGQIPAIRISRCGGKQVRYLIVETTAGKFITGQTVKLKNGQTYYRPLPRIPPGSYKVSIAGNGVPRASHEFTVN